MNWYIFSEIDKKYKDPECSSVTKPGVLTSGFEIFRGSLREP